MQDHSVKLDGVSFTNTAVLRAAAAEDQAAWRELIDTYSGRVYRWARKKGLQDSDAADVLNQVFQAVVRALPDFDREREGGTFRGWLWKITENVIRDFFRNQARQPCTATGGSDHHQQLQNQQQVPDPSSQSTRPPRPPTPESQAIERVRVRTTEKAWQVFWLCSTTELTAEAIAEECKVETSFVYMTKHRISKRIRHELKKILTEPNSGQSS